MAECQAYKSDKGRSKFYVPHGEEFSQFLLTSVVCAEKVATKSLLTSSVAPRMLYAVENMFKLIILLVKVYIKAVFLLSNFWPVGRQKEFFDKFFEFLIEIILYYILI